MHSRRKEPQQPLESTQGKSLREGLGYNSRSEKAPIQPKKNQANGPHVEKSIKKRGRGKCCYICHEKGHFASSCTNGTLSNPIIIDDLYSLKKDKSGNVFAKYVGTQSGVKKRTIWVAKPIVTNLLGPNLVGDQQAQT